MDLKFEWDPDKASSNSAKHGITFDEAGSVFGDPVATIFADPDHSDEELREIIVGYSSKQRLLIVSFTHRPPNIRIISVRKATPQEQRRHENSLFGG